MKMEEETNDFEDMLLQSSRTGNVKTINEIIDAKKNGKTTVDINCKGKSKRNYGWTPLHLSSYFGHQDCVKLLLDNGADIDLMNEFGDTPLHKAALTNREDIILLLLENGANVVIINGEGLKSSDLATRSQAKKLILGAEKAHEKEQEHKLLHAAREGNLDEVKVLLQSTAAPNINCTDHLGNTSLHCAAHRSHMKVAVLLLQNGCDPTIKNNSGNTALDMVQSQPMQQVLAVPPVKSFYRAASRFEGPLLKKTKLVGMRLIWAVLERGVLTFFSRRADASSGVGRRDYRYLDGANVLPIVGGDNAVFVLKFSDKSRYTLTATPDHLHSACVNRQKWISALEDHIKFSTHYVKHGFSVETVDDDDEEKAYKPLGSMEDALSTAKAHQEVLEQRLQEVMALISYVNDDQLKQGPVHNVLTKLTSLSTTALKMSTSLNHCLSLMKQQEEVRELQLKEEKEKGRVLEEALKALATEHHELEESIACHVTPDSRSLYNTPANSFMSLPPSHDQFGSLCDDEFYDVFSRGAGDLSPCDSVCSTNTLVSCISSLPLDSNTPQGDGTPTNSSGSITPTPLECLPSTRLTKGTPTVESLSNALCNSLERKDLLVRSESLQGTISSTSRPKHPSSPYTISLTEKSSLDTPSWLSKTSTGMGSLEPQMPLVRTSDISDHTNVSEDTTSTSLNEYATDTKNERCTFNNGSIAGETNRPEPKTKRHWRTMRRKRLPAPQFQKNEFSLWSVLRHCIGKELSKITMPVVFNEPLSFLQRTSEFMEYAWLLDKADAAQDPLIRMQCVTAFAISGLASNWERLGKPFNPLLGETYELQRDSYRIICEQVSHHPPVSAFAADSPRWTFHGSIHPKLKFVGKSFEIQPKGILTIEFPSHGEAYTWSNVNCCVHNIIVGKLWIEQYGTMEITNHATGHKCVMEFKPAGWLSKDLHRVEGFIMDCHKQRKTFLYGKWTEFIRVSDIESYSEYMNTNVHKFSDLKKEESSKRFAGHKNVLSKLNSITSSFKLSTDVEPSDIETDNGEESNYPRSDSSYSIDIPNSDTLWEVEARPDNSAQFYHFTLFAMSLNELDDELKSEIALTDSRLRPDIRALEEGEIDKAAAEKQRLEEKQRECRKSLKKNKVEYKSRWFDQGQNPLTGQEDWLYSGGYWDRNYTDISDIF